MSVKLSEYRREVAAVQTLVEISGEFPMDVEGEYRVLRFLLDADGDVGSAAEAIRKFFVWRRERGVDAIREEAVQKEFEEIPNFEKISRFLPVNLMLRDSNKELVRDSQGRPISVERTGACDVTGFLAEISMEEIIDMHIAHMEKRSEILDRLSREQGELVQVVLIKDMRETDVTFPIRHPQRFSEFMKRVQEMVEISQKFYPQTVGKAFIYKAPRGFGKIWKFVASNILRRKHEELTEFVDDFGEIYGDKLLPQEYGGKNTAPLSQVPKGGRGRVQGEKFIVGKSQKLQIPYTVKTGDAVHWRAGIEEHEVQFRVEFRKHGNENMEILCQNKLQADVASIRGEWEIREPGNIVFVFDNSNSWVRAKNVFLDVLVDKAAPQAASPEPARVIAEI